MMLFQMSEHKIRADCEKGDAGHEYEKIIHCQSSFIGVMRIATNRITAAMNMVVTTASGFIVLSESRNIAPSVVRRYLTRSNSRLASVSFFRKYLSFMVNYKLGRPTCQRYRVLTETAEA